MKISRTIHIALHALQRNLLRAILTALGIIIGIASVIAMIELGKGSSSAIQRTISSMGSNNVMIFPGTAASGGVSYGVGSVLTLTAEDADAVLAQSTAVKNISPVVRGRAQIVYGNKNWVPQNIYGTTPQYLNVRDWEDLKEGEMFSDRDVRSGKRVCVIGATVARELFQGGSALGKELRIQNVSFHVVGVLATKGANMMGVDQDDVVLAPWTTVKYRISGTGFSTSSNSAAAATPASGALYPTSQVQLYPPTNSNNGSLSRRLENVDQLLLAAKSSQEVSRAIEEVTAILRDRHHLRAGEPDDFTVRDMAEMTKALTSTSALMTRLLLGVALISLVVGGVGIMNIMLVSVTERTREIGLRMAVGARSKDILQQFLVEAVVLCLSGGIIGILFGRGISSLVTTFLTWPTETSIPAIIAAFSVSVSVGLIFGFYPAWKASRLDPIEALRYE